MKNYQETINENKAEFNDAETLTDFLESYANEEENDLLELEDYLNEYVDGLVPIYYHDIIKEWQEITDAQEMTKEVIGEYDSQGNIYKMMQSDLFFYYEQQLTEDYEKLKELLA